MDFNRDSDAPDYLCNCAYSLPDGFALDVLFEGGSRRLSACIIARETNLAFGRLDGFLSEYLGSAVIQFQQLSNPISHPAAVKGSILSCRETVLMLLEHYFYMLRLNLQS